jgi:hypothetical protein
MSPRIVNSVDKFEDVSLIVEETAPKRREASSRLQSRIPIEVTPQQPLPSPKGRQVQTYEPPPLFHTTTVFAFGAVIVVLANIWTPLALLFVWCAARLQRYFFRINDEPSSRRRLLKEFQRKDQLTAPLRQIPDGVKVEESYWVNRRYVYTLRGLLSSAFSLPPVLTPLSCNFFVQGNVIDDQYHYTR